MSVIYVFFADGFEEIEALTSVDVLRRADFEVIMTSVTGDKTVTGAHNVVVQCDELFESCDFSNAEQLILPGGMPGAETLSNHKGLQDLLLNFNAEKRPIAAICAAPMALGKLGILEGRKATCYPGFENHLKGADYTAELVEQEGHIITGKGPGASLPFALKIVETLAGKEKAQRIADEMCFKA